MILEALAARLVSASVATLGTDLFIGLMPDKPDLCLSLYEYAGSPPTEAFSDGGFSLERPGIQVMVRGARDDYPTARALIIAARDALVPIANEQIDGVQFLRVGERSSVNALGRDDNNRPMFSLSLDVVITA